MRLIKEGALKTKEDQDMLNLVVFEPYSSLFCLLNLAVKKNPSLPGILLD